MMDSVLCPDCVWTGSPDNLVCEGDDHDSPVCAGVMEFVESIANSRLLGLVPGQLVISGMMLCTRSCQHHAALLVIYGFSP